MIFSFCWSLDDNDDVTNVRPIPFTQHRSIWHNCKSGYDEPLGSPLIEAGNCCSQIDCTEKAAKPAYVTGNL